MKIVTAAQMREIDVRASDMGLTTAGLMERAGLGVAREIRKWLGGVAGRRVLGLIGPGNNGGDGLVALRYLHDWGAETVVYLLAGERSDDPNLRALLDRRVPVRPAYGDGLLPDPFDIDLGTASIVIDAVLGTGRARPLSGAIKNALERVKEELSKRPDLKIVAVDIPSGMDADTGECDPSTLPAHLTVTLHLPKMAALTASGSGRTGKLVVVDIGIPQELASGVKAELITGDMVAALLPRRPASANKGTFGAALVVAGSRNYLGAASLACLGAGRVGAGLVNLASVPAVVSAAAAHTMETTYVPLPCDEEEVLRADAWKELVEWLPRYDVLLMGCGMGQAAGTQEFVSSFLEFIKPKGMRVVLDADGLNNLAGLEKWWELLGGQSVITPHPGEMARLLGATAPEIQADRLGAAERAASEWGVVVALKGANTVVASPDGALRISPFANPALATAGTGDVLSGMIAGLMAQGLNPFEAATSGVYLHGLAGERLREEFGDAGVLAGDLLGEIPRVIRDLKRGLRQ